MATALLSMCLGVSSTVFIQEAIDDPRPSCRVGVSMYSQCLLVFVGHGDMALLAVNRAFHSGALTLVCFGFRDRVSLALAVTALGSSSFSLSSAEIIGWSGHVQVSFRF